MRTISYQWNPSKIRVIEKINYFCDVQGTAGILMTPMLSSSNFRLGPLVIDVKILEQNKRDQFFNEARQKYEALRNDENNWREYIEETHLWDSTIADGLEENE